MMEPTSAALSPARRPRVRQFVGPRRILLDKAMTLQVRQCRKKIMPAPLPPGARAARLKCAEARFQKLDDLAARHAFARRAPRGDQHPDNKRPRVRLVIEEARHQIFRHGDHVS